MQPEWRWYTRRKRGLLYATLCELRVVEKNHIRKKGNNSAAYAYNVAPAVLSSCVK